LPRVEQLHTLREWVFHVHVTVAIVEVVGQIL
jgi:hypothetical protein